MASKTLQELTSRQRLSDFFRDILNSGREERMGCSLQEGRRVAGMAAKLGPRGPVSPRTSKLGPGWGGEAGLGGPASQQASSVTIPGCHQQTPGLLYSLPPNPIRLFSRASSHEQWEISPFVQRTDS